MRLIIAGGRNYRPDSHTIPFLHDMVRSLSYQIPGDCEVVSGGASGADLIGEVYGHAFLDSVKVFPADWNTHGNAAGPIRNEQMAEYADALIALPGGRGTSDMIRRMESKGKKVIVHPAHGGD